MAIKSSIDLDKLRRDIQREMKKYDVTALPEAQKQYIGEDMIDLMKDQIAKGISPILDAGRFPQYKAADTINKIRKAGAGFSDKGRRARIREKVADAKKGYPYNQAKKYPGKRVTPVNLFLSGEFLDNLQARATKTGLAIGFWSSKFEKYEQGHREGANGQPMRPIIPNEQETFSRNVYQRLIDSLQKRLLTFFG